MKLFDLQRRTMIAMCSLLASFNVAAAAPGRSGFSTPLIDVGLPEGAGQIRGAYVRRHANGVSQETVLASDRGETNYVDIAIQTGPMLSFNKAPVWKPTSQGIHAELADKFRGMRMQVISDRSIQNQYGVIGVAVGGNETANCVYAWQYYDDARQAFAGGEFIHTTDDDDAPAALRFKYCSRYAPVESLITLVEGLTISIPADFNSPALAGGRSPGYSRAVRRHARYARKPKCNCGPGEDNAGASSTNNKSNLRQTKDLDSYSPSTSDGLRFMAPVEGPAGGGGGDYRSGATLSPNLPARAYRGPDWEPNSPAAR